MKKIALTLLALSILQPAYAMKRKKRSRKDTAIAELQLTNNREQKKQAAEVELSNSLKKNKEITVTENEIKVAKMPKKGMQRVRNIYDPSSQKPYKLSRSKLELFMRCKRCFYIDRRLGVEYPKGYPFSLNLAVHELLKKEFDVYRLKQKPHPICLENKVHAVPFNHEKLESWRKSPQGVQYRVPNTNLLIHGSPNDIWIDQDTGELIVVDYKATSKNGEVTLDADWQADSKRQAEVYQWLLRRNGFKVANTAYFVYCNGKKDMPRLDKKLHFDLSLLSYKGDDSWVETAIHNAHTCLQKPSAPGIEESCEHCQYCEGVKNSLKK